MANVRELMARLGPSTVKFDTGRGGTTSPTRTLRLRWALCLQGWVGSC